MVLNCRRSLPSCGENSSLNVKRLSCCLFFVSRIDTFPFGSSARVPCSALLLTPGAGGPFLYFAFSFFLQIPAMLPSELVSRKLAAVYAHETSYTERGML